MTNPGRNPDDGIERLLRRSMSAPIPSLPSEFDQRLACKLGRHSPVLNHYRVALLTGYTLVSVTVCAALMRGQGLGWSTIGTLIVAPLATLGVARSVWTTAKKTNSVEAS